MTFTNSDTIKIKKQIYEYQQSEKIDSLDIYIVPNPLEDDFALYDIDPSCAYAAGVTKVNTTKPATANMATIANNRIVVSYMQVIGCLASIYNLRKLVLEP